MAKIKFDVEAFEALRRAESDPEQAAEAMRIAARYLRDELPLPMGLREWLADALDDAALKPAAYRSKALAEALHLKVNNRRPAGDWLLIGAEFDARMTSDRSEAAVADEVAGIYQIDPRTAKKYWDKFREARDKHDSVTE